MIHVKGAPAEPDGPLTPIRPPLRDRKFADSLLEEGGFEPLVPLTYDGDAFQNTYPASPGLRAPEVGPAQNGMRSDQPFERLLVMRRSGDIAICREPASLPFRRKWDQRFESAFLHRRVCCEPDFSAFGPIPRERSLAPPNFSSGSASLNSQSHLSSNQRT
jgi:hypothetical protein